MPAVGSLDDLGGNAYKLMRDAHAVAEKAREQVAVPVQG